MSGPRLSYQRIKPLNRLLLRKQIKMSFLSDEEKCLTSILEEYQRDSALADVSGQLKEWVASEFGGLSLNTLACLVDTIGESIANDVMTETFKEEHGVTAEEARAWMEENITKEISRCCTALSQQVSVHTFLIGFKFAEAINKEKQDGSSRVR